jgi:hypothetical protein
MFLLRLMLVEFDKIALDVFGRLRSHPSDNSDFCHNFSLINLIITMDRHSFESLILSIKTLLLMDESR